MLCKKCNHNFTGNPGRIHEHLKSKPGDVKGFTFNETNDKREVWDEIDVYVQSNTRCALKSREPEQFV